MTFFVTSWLRGTETPGTDRFSFRILVTILSMVSCTYIVPSLFAISEGTDEDDPEILPEDETDDL
jgi:hypothetical protein